MVAEVIINSNVNKLNKVFDYEIPDDMNVDIGTRVFVPFGNKKALEEGIVVAIKEKSEYKIKQISGLQEEQIKDEYIDLAKWMSKRYFCNVASALNLMLPPGKKAKEIQNRVKEKTVNFVSLAIEQEEIERAIEEGKIKSDKQKNALEFIINNGDSTIQDIELFTDATKSVVNTLVKNGYLEISQKQVERNPFLHKVDKKNASLKLTEEQQAAFEQIQMTGKYLLYGVTRISVKLKYI